MTLTPSTIASIPRTNPVLGPLTITVTPDSPSTKTITALTAQILANASSTDVSGADADNPEGTTGPEGDKGLIKALQGAIKVSTTLDDPTGVVNIARSVLPDPFRDLFHWVRKGRWGSENYGTTMGIRTLPGPDVVDLYRVDQDTRSSVVLTLRITATETTYTNSFKTTVVSTSTEVTDIPVTITNSYDAIVTILRNHFGTEET